MNQKAKIQTLLDNTPFPGAGQSIGGHQVIESAVDLQGKNWAIYLRGKLSSQQVKKALKKLTSTHFALPVQDKFSLVSFTAKGMTHARTNPPGDVTVVRGHMYYARPNPISSSEFDKEMDEMLIDNPEKHFTKYTVKNQDQLHERLWKGVSYAGEAYGWQKGDDLWHRRASFIMPKIKINKALKGATMFYHTHPAKDEPSLTSADDIQFYLDLHFRWGIKDFYTVMKHKLDYFKITGKKGGKEKYLRMEEEAFIDAVDGLIEEGEKVAKKEVGEDSPDVDFQNRITKEMVDRFNKKFSNIAKISFRPKRKNPRSKLAKKSASPLSALLALRPNPPIRVEDKYVAKALDELKGLDYAHEHYGADEYGHTMYVYWWLKHHLAPTPKQPKGRLFKLNEYGMDSDTRKKLRQYLSQPVIGNYNNMDVVYLLALYHDIAKLREKNAKEPGWEIGAEMFRKEIGPELKLPEKLIEDLAFLLNTDLGRKGITDTDFLPQAGDYYGACKLVHMADMITHHPTMYTKQGGEAYKQEAMVQMIDQLRDFLDHNYVLPNPPPRVTTLKWISSYGLINLTMEEVEELLGEFHQSVVPDEDGNLAPPGDRSSGGHLYSMRFNAEVVPGLSRPYKANFALSSSNLNITVGKPVPEDLGKQDANLIYQAVGEKLKESYPDIELEPVEPEALVNPRHAGKIQVILISGPSGGGKSTVLKYLHRHLPDSSIPPTYTTRPRRPTDGPDRKFVTKATFKKMIEQGKLVEYVVGGNGHYYGRVFDDFEGKYAIVEVTLQGKKHYETRFPNVFSIYLDPDPKLTEKDRAKAIFRRGGLSMEEAKRRAKVATENVKKSKKVNFDLRVTMKKGNYLDGARRVLHNLPLNNPSEDDEDEEEAPKSLTLKDFGIEGFTPPPAERVYLGEEFVQPPTTQPELDEVGVDISGSIEVPKLFDEKEEERRKRRRAAEAQERLKATKQTGLPFDTVQLNEEAEEEENPPKDLFDWFEEWSELINMKNKEMKAFMKSPWFKVAGLTPAEAKKMGIKSGQNSFRAIIRMRKKLGLTGPKDYIDYRKPRTVEAFYEKAVDKWNQTDWDWCKTQVRFNKRHSGFPYNKAKESTKGPLIKKQKTQNQPSRRLLGLWVWAHDPWRWARKQGVANMPKCPDVPWVGMTEKRKYGKLEVIDGPPARRNPPQVYYHGSPVDNIEVLRKGSYVTPDYQTAYDMGRYYTKTGETWEDDDLEYPMKWGTSPVFKQGREPDGVPTIYTVELYDDDLTALGQDEDGVNWEYKTNIEAPVEIIRQNMPRALEADNFKIKDIGPTLSATGELTHNLLRAIQNLRHQNREYVGYANGFGQIAYSTNFKGRATGEFKSEAEKRKLFQDIKPIIGFHTHPVSIIGRKSQDTLSDIPSPPDYTYHFTEYMNYGLQAEIVSTQHGFWVISFRPREEDKKLTQEEYTAERKAIFKGAEKAFFSSSEIMTPLNRVNKVVETINDKTQFYDCLVRFFDYPVFAVKWKGATGGSMRGKIARVNPHYTPPPGIAMFPGELHQGPAALYQQTISISQLNPPRSKPFPWNKARVKKSPFKTMKRAKATYASWKAGNVIGSTATSSLKSMGKIPRVSGKYELGEKYARINPHGGAHRIPKKYEGQDPSKHSDLYTDEDPKGTIKGLGFKDKATAIKSINIIKRSGKTHAHKIQAAMAMEQRARFHPNQTPGIKAAQKVYATFIEEMKKKTKAKRNPRTPGGKKVPTRYLKGLTKLEKLIAEDEIDKGYKYDVNDPEAYKFWQSDIKATARGLKIGPSKHRIKYYKKYRKNINKDYKPSGKTPKQKFLNRIRKETKIKKSILEKIYDKGLAAWRTGHRPGVQQHQWAAGRVYAFVVGADSSTGPGKPDHKLAVEAGVR